MPNLKNQIAVITGASSGIGRAIALSLAAKGVALCLMGRNLKTLEAVTEGAKSKASQVKTYKVDLNVDDDIQKLKQYLQQDFGYIDILIHSAGIFSMGVVENAPVEDLDRQYRINVRVPYLLTQTLLSMIKSRQGQIVFINSSVGLNAKANAGQYAATKHALKAIADSLRDEVNAYGIRVLSVYPGRTATPMQALVHELEGKAYEPEKLMQPEDVAEVVVNALSLPRTAEVTDIHIRPLNKI
jgi:short-subunit dehydrogenase